MNEKLKNTMVEYAHKVYDENLFGAHTNNISARVEITLKKIVEDSSFTHKDAYELGAKLIAMGEAENTIMEINNKEDKSK